MEDLFGCTMALSYGAEVMLCGEEHVLFELTVLYKAVVFQQEMFL